MLVKGFQNLETNVPQEQIGCGERAVGRGCGERACPMTLGEGSSQSARRGPERTIPWPYSSPAL